MYGYRVTWRENEDKPDVKRVGFFDPDTEHNPMDTFAKAASLVNSVYGTDVILHVQIFRHDNVPEDWKVF